MDIFLILWSARLNDKAHDCFLSAICEAYAVSIGS